MHGRTNIRKALSLSFIRTLISLLFNIATVTIVSRLLTPAEVGVFSVAVALVALVHMLRDFGITELIIQENILTNDLVRTVFTFNVLIAWTLATIVFLSSGFVGDFYYDHGVSQVMKVLSIVFIIMPFGTTTLACMKRDMKFDLLVKIQIAETAIRSCTTITLAWLGFSYMSMAWASVAAAAVVALCTYSFGGHYRVSGLGLKDWKRVLHFGSFRTVSDLARQVGDQSTSIVIGRMLGLPSAGYYSRGYGIVNIFQSSFVSAVGSVAFPAYAKKHRESDSAPTLFRRSMALMTGVSWPLFSYAALMAYPIIHLAFGNQWDASIPLMRWLCIAAIVGTLIYQVNGLLTAMGRYREVTIIELFYQPARIVLTMVAAFHSLEAVAASQIVAYIFAVYLYYRKLIRIDELRIGLLIPSIAPSAILAICTSLSPILVIFFWPGPMADHFLPAFIVSSVCSGLIWLFGMFIIKHPLSQEISKAVSMIGARLQLFSRGGNSDSS